jgi:hypothetical protein
MGVPWFRIAMMIAMMSSDDVEGVCASIAHVILSWSLREFFGICQQMIMIPKLVRAGKVHPESWRRARVPYVSIAFYGAVSAGVQWGLHAAGRARLGYFLIITAGVLPVFKCVTYPYLWPIVPFLGFILHTVWRLEGVRELFVGLTLYQGVSTAQEVRGWYFGPNVFWSLAIWLVAFAAVMPILLIFGAAYFHSNWFERVIRRRKKPEYQKLWWYFEQYASLLGYETEEGEDPFRVLGVSRTSTSTQIRKRFRDLSMKYHPDKTGNDQKKKEMFIKVQRAMETITKGTYEDTRPSDEHVVRERAFATIARCGSLWGLIAIWLALSITAAIGYLIRRRLAKDDPEAAEAENQPRMHTGPSFVGADIFGMGDRRRARRPHVDNTNAGGARVVGNMRVATPSGQAPRIISTGPRETDAWNTGIAGADGGRLTSRRRATVVSPDASDAPR